MSGQDDRTLAMPMTPPAPARFDGPDDARPVAVDAPPPDGDPVLPDGEPVLPDGDPVLPDGEPVLPDGDPVLPADMTQDRREDTTQDRREDTTQDRLPSPPDADPWSRLAGEFVDEPQAAVAQAERLVQEAVDAVLSRVARASRPEGDGAASTEDLRHAFRRYRDIHGVVSTL